MKKQNSISNFNSNSSSIFPMSLHCRNGYTSTESKNISHFVLMSLVDVIGRAVTTKHGTTVNDFYQNVRRNAFIFTWVDELPHCSQINSQPNNFVGKGHRTQTQLQRDRKPKPMNSELLPFGLQLLYYILRFLNSSIPIICSNDRRHPWVLRWPSG